VYNSRDTADTQSDLRFFLQDFYKRGGIPTGKQGCSQIAGNLKESILDFAWSQPCFPG
jgi:hypothetical protein